MDGLTLPRFIGLVTAWVLCIIIGGMIKDNLGFQDPLTPILIMVIIPIIFLGLILVSIIKYFMED